MKNFVTLQLILTIWICKHQTNGYIIKGPNVNVTYIYWKAYLKGIGEMLNLLPDTTYNDNYWQRKPGSDAAVGRRSLKNIIASFRKLLQDNDDSKDIVSNDFTDFDQTFRSGDATNILKHKDTKYRLLKSIKETKRRQPHFPNYFIRSMMRPPSAIIGPTLKENGQQKPEKAERDGVGLKKSKKVLEKKQLDIQEKYRADAANEKFKKEQQRKIEEITNFLNGHYMSTNYIYSEVQRIQQTREIKDSLRTMVEYLERPGSEELKQSVIQCFLNKKQEIRPTKNPANLWSQRPNNLVIHVLKDPNNDGLQRK